MALHLVVDVITRQLQSAQVPGLEATMECVRKSLEKKSGEPIALDELTIPDLQVVGHVDDYWLSYEWSEGGVMHAHSTLWIVGSPRIDLKNVPRELSKGAIEVGSDSKDVRVLACEEAAPI